MSISDRKQWLESPAGTLQRALGADPWAIDYEAADRLVSETVTTWQRVYDRTLTDREVAQIRTVAEQRSTATVIRDVPTDVPELVQRVNAASVTAGWSYTPTFRGSSSGIAMRNSDGTYSGDPVVVAAAQEAEEQKRRQAEAEYEQWRSGPAILRTVAGPTRE